MEILLFVVFKFSLFNLKKIIFFFVFFYFLLALLNNFSVKQSKFLSHFKNLQIRIEIYSVLHLVSLSKRSRKEILCCTLKNINSSTVFFPSIFVYSLLFNSYVKKRTNNKC